MIADREESFLKTEIMETDYLTYSLRNKNESIIPLLGYSHFASLLLFPVMKLPFNQSNPT